ncbi:hypothetical protein HPB50_006006 [Hyalomma asiaticum]|uniref:Uncharacterized protein n=1 Tax=Hyalomma asiaticum TaxID=266040 RepID=A0ACB7SEW8_HYAAI|nr:hypothetical protein HPB50_006006 [Hyalomma asiaticum]
MPPNGTFTGSCLATRKSPHKRIKEGRRLLALRTGNLSTSNCVQGPLIIVGSTLEFVVKCIISINDDIHIHLAEFSFLYSEKAGVLTDFTRLGAAFL